MNLKDYLLFITRLSRKVITKISLKDWIGIFVDDDMDIGLVAANCIDVIVAAAIKKSA